MLYWIVRVYYIYIYKYIYIYIYILVEGEKEKCQCGARDIRIGRHRGGKRKTGGGEMRWRDVEEMGLVVVVQGRMLIVIIHTIEI